MISAELDRILAATRRVMARDGLDAVTLAGVAKEAGIDPAWLASDIGSHEDLLFELLCDIRAGPLPAIHDVLRTAENGEAVLDGFLRVFFHHYSQRMDDFRTLFLYPQCFGAERLGLSRARAAERLSPIGEQLHGPPSTRLAADWGTTELPHGIHPRRLVFIASVAAIGLLTFKGLVSTVDDPLKHSDEALIAELSAALASPTRVMRQLSALNRASTELAAIREEQQLLDRVPGLLCETLEVPRATVTLATDGAIDGPALYRACFSEDRTCYVSESDDGDGPAVVTPLRCQGEPAGIVVAQPDPEAPPPDRRDISRLEVFAAMVGLALDNVRFYGALNAKVEARTRQLREAQAALVQTEKIAALGRLVAGVTHELNSPLGAIQSAQDSLQRAVTKLQALPAGSMDEPSVSRRAQATLAVIRDAAAVLGAGVQRVSSTIDRLQRFARLDRAELERADINQCVEDALASVGLPASVRVKKALGDLPELLCSPAQLNQVFANLFLNAVQAMPAGGQIEITTRRSPGSVHVAIADTGQGVAPEHLPHVFEPGFTTRGVGVGTGLGLTSCHQVVRQHGGEIELDSHPGLGTTVRITLPLRSDGG